MILAETFSKEDIMAKSYHVWSNFMHYLDLNGVEKRYISELTERIRKRIIEMKKIDGHGYKYIKKNENAMVRPDEFELLLDIFKILAKFADSQFISLFRKQPVLKHDIILYRGINDISYLKESLQGIFFTKGYTSVTSDKTVAKRFAQKALLVINIHSGFKVLPVHSRLTYYPNEYEFILPKNAAFIINNVTDFGSTDLSMENEDKNIEYLINVTYIGSKRRLLETDGENLVDKFLKEKEGKHAVKLTRDLKISSRTPPKGVELLDSSPKKHFGFLAKSFPEYRNLETLTRKKEPLPLVKYQTKQTDSSSGYASGTRSKFAFLRKKTKIKPKYTKKEQSVTSKSSSSRTNKRSFQRRSFKPKKIKNSKDSRMNTGIM
jgi:hypothetical protein